MPRILRRRSASRSDIGRRREQNEDAALADDTLGLYVVADGVGGHAKGEVASAESVAEVRSFVVNGLGQIDRYLAEPTPAHESQLRRLVESAIQHACYMVWGIAEQDPEGRGMATTLSLMLAVGDLAIIGQVGDSRIYRVRGGQLQQLTEDHTFANYQVKRGVVTAEQAKTMKGRNLITRAVGQHDHVEVDTSAVELAPGDRYLLCSDGLHGYFREDAEVLALLSERRVADVCRRCIDMANERGGKDNITAVAIDFWA